MGPHVARLPEPATRLVRSSTPAQRPPYSPASSISLTVRSVARPPISLNLSRFAELALYEAYTGRRLSTAQPPD